jgi:hypothetical protein
MRHIFFALLFAAVALGGIALLVQREGIDHQTLLAPVALIEVAAEAPQPRCISEDKTLSDVKAQVPDVVHEVYSGAKAKSYVDTLNTLPPATRYPTPDTVIIFTSASRLNLLFTAFRGGCQIMVGYMQPERHQAVLAIINTTI